MRTVSILSGVILAIAAAAFAFAGDAPPKVGQLKSDSVFIFASTMAGTKDKFGFPSNELYAAAIDGSDVVRLTYSGFSQNHFVVSPDRTMIAVNRYVKGDTSGDGHIAANDYKELWIVDMVHGKEWPLAQGMDAGYGGLAWSPDSKLVYFSSFSDPSHTKYPGDPMDIYRVSIAGGTPQKLTANLSTLLGATSPNKFVSDIDVSPDGEWMAMVYVAHEAGGGTKPKSRIAVVRVDGTAAHVVTDGGEAAPAMRGMFGVGDVDPDFSPDGKSFAFARITTTGMVGGKLSTHEVHVVNVDGTGLRDLSPAHNPDAHGIPSWGDNCKVLYTVWTERVSYPYPEYINPDGTGRTIIKLPGDATHSQWIPNGHWTPVHCPGQ